MELLCVIMCLFMLCVYVCVWCGISVCAVEDLYTTCSAQRTRRREGRGEEEINARRTSGFGRVRLCSGDMATRKWSKPQKLQKQQPTHDHHDDDVDERYGSHDTPVRMMSGTVHARTHSRTHRSAIVAAHCIPHAASFSAPLVDIRRPSATTSSNSSDCRTRPPPADNTR